MHIKQLSPMLLSSMRERQRNPSTKAEGGNYTVVYQCDRCLETHVDMDDAIDCCKYEEDGTMCPACGTDYFDHRAAADCCMGIDLGAPVRWRIADAVKLGATWAEAIQKITGQSIY